jgi:hypothetical protein
MKHRHQRMLTGFACLGTLAATALLATAQTDPTSARSRTQFQTIASKLDLGGDLLLVANTDAIVDQFMAAAISSEAGVPAEDPNEREIRETLERFHKFLNRNGFSALQGVGLSLSPREDDQHALKLFVSRDYVDSNLPLWRGMVGWHPRRLLSLDFIPGNAVMARAGTPELASLWGVLRSAVDEVAPEPTQKRFDEWHRALNEALGMELETLVKSLRDEALVAVQLSDTEKSVMPTKNGFVTIPAPSFLIVVGTNDDMLRGMIEAQFAKHKITLTETQVGDIVMRSTVNKLPSLIPLQPAYASQAGFFLFGSTPDIVAEALLAYRHKNGLLARPKFRTAFQGLSMVNNGIIYVSPKMGEVLGSVSDANMKEAMASTGKHPATARMLRQLMTHGGRGQSCALTIQNWKKGVMVMGTSGWGGKDIVARLCAEPLRVVTSLLDGSFQAPSAYPFPLFNAISKDAVAPVATEPDSEAKKTLPTSDEQLNLK